MGVASVESWPFFRRSQNIIRLLNDVREVKAELIANVMGHQPSGVYLEFDAAVTGMTSNDVVDRLMAGDPPIWTRVRPGAHLLMAALASFRQSWIVTSTPPLS